jgi:RNA polymerase sigma-70 factor (ECF subfamily)
MRTEPSEICASGSCGRSFAELQTLSDELLMVHVKGGHDDALAILFDRYHRLVLSIGYKILRDLGEAEDLAQSVFLEISRVAGQFDPLRGTTKIWLLQYAYHRSINRRRYLLRRDFYGQTDLEDASRQSQLGRCSAEGVFGSVEARKILAPAIAELSAAQRKTIQMAYFEGLTVREISEKTGEPITIVRHNYYRGLCRLRKLILEKGSKKEAPVRRGIIDAEA